MSEEEKKEQGFQVKDRRRFTQEGEHREKVAPEEKPVADEAEGKAAGDSDAAGPDFSGGGETTGEHAEFPEINFATFVMSLSSSVLIHLGLAPDPATGETRRELGIAKQTIDILGMLQEKTRGNLSEEENRLMEGMLYDLRMRYVEEAKK